MLLRFKSLYIEIEEFKGSMLHYYITASGMLQNYIIKKEKRMPLYLQNIFGNYNTHNRKNYSQSYCALSTQSTYKNIFA